MKRSCFNEEQIIGILKQQPTGLGAKKPCRKRAVRARTRMAIPRGRRSLYFISDALRDGPRFRVLNVIHNVSWKGFAVSRHWSE